MNQSKLNDARFIEVSAEVRYWDDAEINGVSREDGATVPLKQENLWCPMIRLDDGKVMDWPKGITADIHFKVCDQGQYWLLDADKKRIAKWSGHYVPDDFLCHGDNGYGDYIIFSVDSDGQILSYQQPTICSEDRTWIEP